jgi:hypothetical protein
MPKKAALAEAQADETAAATNATGGPPHLHLTLQARMAAPGSGRASLPVWLRFFRWRPAHLSGIARIFVPGLLLPALLRVFPQGRVAS